MHSNNNIVMCVCAQRLAVYEIKIPQSPMKRLSSLYSLQSKYAGVLPDRLVKSLTETLGQAPELKSRHPHYRVNLISVQCTYNQPTTSQLSLQMYR